MALPDNQKLEAWAFIAQIVSAVGVVVSVLYLGLQIGDNTKALHSHSHYNAVQLAQRPIELVVESEALGRAVSNCFQGTEEVTPADRFLCDQYVFMMFNAWEYAYYQLRDGSIPDELWSGIDGGLKSGIVENPAWGRAWSRIEASFGGPFRSYVGEQIAKAKVAGR